MPPRKNLRLASFDVGGVRGFSQLEIMRSIMHWLNWNKTSSGFEGHALPCQHFDLIGGSGTGGILAIMFTRLRMSVEEASEEFFTITEEVYKADELDSSERSRRLRQCLEGMLQKRGLPLDMKLMEETRENSCAGFVVASLRNNLETRICLRTYPVRAQPSSTITVVEAILATCATQPAFAPVSFGERYRKREYVGAGFGANNPIQEVITEAHFLFGGDSSVSSLLSLGTGHPGIISLSSQTNGDNLYQGMRDTMNDCEQKAQDMEQRLGPVGIYSRFSVDQGMQNNEHGQATDPEWITSQTEGYLARHDTLQKLDTFVRNVGSEEGDTTLDQLRHVGGRSITGMGDMVGKSYDILISNQDDAIIEKLKPPNLEYDPHVSECMEGTRQDILSEIIDWTNDTEAPNILWLKGYPGVGKSTISTTLTEKLRSLGRLGSSFFFRREMAEAMTPRALWRRTAYDLGCRYLPARKHLVALLTANKDILTTPNVNTLFHQLLVDPLTASDDIPPESLPVVVIDALDECGGLDGQRSDHRKSLMRSLGDWSHLPRRFKLVVTSRGESDIEHLFSTTVHHLVEISAGQTVKPHSSNDIMTFLECHFREITAEYPKSLPLGWPGDDVVRKLTEMAGGLFIWVETIIKLIKQGEPQQRLGYILQRNGSGGLVALYSSILQTSFPSPSPEELTSFRTIIGSVILMKQPLPISSLLSLLSIEVSMMEYVCNRLRSVMDCRDALRVHHQSFVDFLMDQEACPPAFLIDRGDGHQNLTRACLRVMNSNLQFNIHGLKSSYTLNRDVENLSSLVVSNISAQLSYSSHFWASHLAESTFDDAILDHLHEFMHEKFLFWLEVLSLTKGVNLASTMVMILTKWLRAYDQDTEMARDMERFVAAFASVISQSVPHIYLSALAFSPLTSIVRKQYKDRYPLTLKIVDGGQASWPAMQKLFAGHENGVASVAFSPDGKRVVSGSYDKTVRIWDAETGELVTEPFEGHSDTISSVAFSPDGRRVVSGSWDNTIQIWDAKTRELVTQPLKCHKCVIHSVAFSPDGRRAVSGSWQSIVQIWDLETAEPIMQSLENNKGFVSSVAFSPDGKRVISGSEDKSIRIWDAETGELVTRPLEGHNGAVCSIAFSPDGKHVVSGSKDKTVRIWDSETGELVIQPFEGHDGTINSVAFSPDGGRIVSGSLDSTIRIWNAETGKLVTEPLEGHEDEVNSVSFSPDGRRVVSGSFDKTVRIWDVEMREFITQQSKDSKYSLTSAAFSPDGRSVVTGSEDGEVQIWDIRTGELIAHPLKGHKEGVISIAFSSDGMRAVSGHWDCTVQIWDTETGRLRKQAVGANIYGIGSVPFSLDSRNVLSGFWNDKIGVWDTETGESVIKTLEGHTNRATSAAFSPDGKRVVVGCEEEKVQIWNVETGERITQPLAGDRATVTCVAFSPDGERVVSGSKDKTIRIWDVETGTLVTQLFVGHEGGVNSVAFSPDGRWVVCGSGGKTVQIWNIQTGELVTQPFVGHKAGIKSVAFSPDGSWVVSTSWDGTVRIWDVPTSKRVVQRIKTGFSCLSVSQTDNHSPQNWSSIDDILPTKEEDGWVLGPNSELLFWVPPTLRLGLYLPRNRLILGSCIKTRLCFKQFVHGEDWTLCRENPTQES